MRIKYGVSALALMTGLGLIAHASPASAATAEDKRIAALEAQVKMLMDEVHHIKSENAAAPAHRHGRHGQDQAEAAPYGGPPAAPNAPYNTAYGNGSNNPPASSPDTPRPVSAGGPSALIPGASIVGGKPTIASADGRFVANLHGVMQFDYANYFQGSTGPITEDFRRSGTGDSAHARDLASGTDFRRARIGIDGKAFGDFEYNILFDFGGSGSEDAGHVQELWAQYSGIKPFHLRVGAFQPSIGLEDQNSTNGMPFLERPESVDVTRGLSAGDFREGAEVWANGKQWFASGAVTTRLVGVNNTGNTSTTVTSTSTNAGVTKSGASCFPFSSTCLPVSSTSTLANGASGVTVPFNQAVGFVGRAVINPFEGKNYLTHLGVHGSYGQVANTGGPDAESTGVDLRVQAETRVDVTRLIDTGNIQAAHISDVGAEAAYQWKGFYVEGEYDHIMLDRRDSQLSNPSFDGYYAEASYILTGERRKYNVNTASFDAPPVAHPFSWAQKSWGAWEVALRYSDMDLNYHAGAAGSAPAADGIRGGNQKIFTAGLNWYLNPIVRAMIDYQHVDVDRLSPSATTFKTPTGAQIGQAYNAVEVRTQLAF